MQPDERVRLTVGAVALHHHRRALGQPLLAERLREEPAGVLPQRRLDHDHTVDDRARRHVSHVIRSREVGRTGPDRRCRGPASAGETEVLHATQHDHVVAGLDDLLEGAVEERMHVLEDRAEAPDPPRHLTEPVGAAASRRADEIGSWCSSSTLTVKCPARSMRGQVVDDFAAQNSTSGGSSETEVKELAARPTGLVAVHGGDHGDAGGEVTEHGAERRRVRADHVGFVRHRRSASAALRGGPGVRRSGRSGNRRTIPSAAATTSAPSICGRTLLRLALEPVDHVVAVGRVVVEQRHGAARLTAWPRARRSPRCNGPSGASSRTRSGVCWASWISRSTPSQSSSTSSGMKSSLWPMPQPWPWSDR